MIATSGMFLTTQAIAAIIAAVRFIFELLQGGIRYRCKRAETAQYDYRNRGLVYR